MPRAADHEHFRIGRRAQQIGRSGLTQGERTGTLA